MPSLINVKSIKHPDTFNNITGKTQLSELIESINQSIRLILTTSPGELWGDPSFGSSLNDYLFEYSGDMLSKLIKTEITRALTLWEPRVLISESDISINYEGVNAYISINYAIKYTNYTSSYQYITRINEGRDF